MTAFTRLKRNGAALARREHLRQLILQAPGCQRSHIAALSGSTWGTVDRRVRDLIELGAVNQKAGGKLFAVTPLREPYQELLAATQKVIA